jgi:uncharacterized protein
MWRSQLHPRASVMRFAMAFDTDLKRERPPAATLVGLGVALSLPLLTNVVVRHFLGDTISTALMTVGLVIHWVTFGVLLLIVRRWECAPLQSIGWHAPRWSTIPIGIVAGVIIAVVSGVVGDRLEPADTHVFPLMQALPLVLRVALVITAGVFEETMYRGYGIERLSRYFGGKWVAAAITVGLFTLAHAPTVGAAHLPSILLGASLMTGLYLWRRDLLLNMVAHSTINAIGLLVLPALQ